jgi:hypothetical protein
MNISADWRDTLIRQRNEYRSVFGLGYFSSMTFAGPIKIEIMSWQPFAEARALGFSLRRNS